MAIIYCSWKFFVVLGLLQQVVKTLDISSQTLVLASGFVEVVNFFSKIVVFSLFVGEFGFDIFDLVLVKANLIKH